MQHMNERQTQLMSTLLAFVREHPGDGLLKTTDADVEAAAGALAATHETAGRGLIYEHRPSSLPAQRLAEDLTRFVAQVRGESGSSFDEDLAAVFRAIERGARDAAKKLPGAETAYLALLRRVIAAPQPKGDRGPDSALLQPGGSLLVRP